MRGGIKGNQLLLMGRMCAGVRKNAVMVLSHLILNDMMKVKGHIARLALCLRDADRRIVSLAALFFHELASKASKVRNFGSLLETLHTSTAGRT